MTKRRLWTFALAALLAGAGALAAAELSTPPIPSFSPEAQAQREAVSLIKEGDHQQKEGNLKEAREEWLAALEAYRRSGFKAGEPEALFRLGASYQAEAAVDIQKQKLMLAYTTQALLAGAEFLESVLKGETPADPDSFQRAEALLKQASDLAAAGNCGDAVPLFSQAGEASDKGGWAKGEARSLAGRLRCLLKSDDLSLLMMGMMSGATELPALFQKLKPKIQPGPTVHYLKAIEDDQLGNWKDAESEYRKVLQETQASGDSLAIARIELDLGGVLARTGNLAEAETLFRRASEGFVLQGPDSRRNQAAAIQNLAGVNLATGRIDAAITSYKQALELWKTLDEKAREAEALRTMSSALRQKGDDASANAALAEAEKLEERPVARPQAGGAPGGTAEETQGQDAAQEPKKPPVSASLAEGVIFSLSPRAQAQREATLLLGEGDRLLQAGNLRQAREKWQASVEAFKRAANRQSVAKCYKRLADSYAGEAMFDDKKRLLAADYYSQAVTELAKEAEEDRRRNDSYLDDEELRKAGSLLDAASQLADSGSCAKALPMLAEARLLYQRASLAYGEARSLMLRGRCEAIDGDLGSAFATSMEGLSILVALPVSAPPSELALKAGELLSLGRQSEALALYQEVLCRYEQAKDIAGIASTLREFGAVQSSMGDLAEAELTLSRALSLLPAVASEDNRSDEASLHHNLGGVYAATGRSSDAVAELRLALSLWRDLGDLDTEVASLSSLGVALSDQGDFPEALAALDQAEKLQKRLSPNPELDGDLLNNRGKVYRSQGRYQEALDSFRKAEILYRPLPVGLKDAQARNNIGTVEEALGDFEKARSSYQQARKIARQLGTANLEIKVELNEANGLFESGKYQEAIQAFLNLLPKASNDEEAQVVMWVHNNLGAAYLRVGDGDKARPQFEEALKIAKRIGNPEFVATIHVNRGYFLSQAGDAAGADEETRKGLQIWKDLGNNVMANIALGNLGWQAISKKFSEEDLQVFKKGLESSRKAELATDSLRFSLLLGAGCLQREDFAGVIEHASQALAEADRINDSAGQYVGRSMLMEAHYRQGDSLAALRDLDAVVAGLDRWQSGLTLSEFKSSFLAQPLFFDTYALGVLLNAENGKPEEAFYYAEQARARAFRDQIGNQRIEVQRGGDPELIRQEGELRAQLAHLGEAIQKENAGPVPKRERLDSLKKAQEEAQSNYATLLVRLKLANSEYAALVSVNALSLREVQQALDEQTTLIEYFVPDPPERGGPTQVFAWVIDRDHFTMIRLPVSSSRLATQIDLLRKLIATRDSVQTQETELYRDLFAPLAPHVRHRNLVIVPHGVLHFLPFAALWDEANRRYLGDAYALSYAPSATVLKFAREKTARAVGPVLVAGNPDGSLPAAASEARAVARLYGGEPLLGRTATEGTVVTRAGQAGILHLAAHAELNPINPLFTRVKLAPDSEHDGNLEMHEVFGLDLSKTGLVVLSGCSTQMGKLTAGDELDGLTRAFLYAGTPAVMASLWDVQDESTSFFMQRFYVNLRKEIGRAEALRLAQMETRRRFPHPYQWAAFVLTGDGR